MNWQSRSLSACVSFNFALFAFFPMGALCLALLVAANVPRRATTRAGPNNQRRHDQLHLATTKSTTIITTTAMRARI